MNQLPAVATVPTGDVSDVVESERRPSRRRSLIWTGVWIVVALISLFVVSPIVSGPSFAEGFQQSLDGMLVAVSGMALGATSLSLVLSAFPGDAASPIADQLAELSSYFIVITGAILLLKMLVAVVGYVAFTFIIPAACLVGIASIYVRVPGLRALAYRLAVFAVVIFIAVPASITLSQTMNSAYAHSAEQAAADADRVANEAEALADETAKAAENADRNILEMAGDAISGFFAGFGEAFEKIKDDAVATLNTYMQQIAVFIVTTCVIPVLTILLFGWVIKILFGFQIPMANIGGARRAFASRVRGAGRRPSGALNRAESIP